MCDEWAIEQYVGVLQNDKTYSRANRTSSNQT
jgi:hypothetical protein